MSKPQQPRPAPPPNYADWLDYAISNMEFPTNHEEVYARAELTELRKALAEAQGKLAIATANAAELAQQRDSLRAQVAELRDVVLAVGELTGTEVHVGWGATLRVHISHDNAQSFNALVSRLRAQAPGEEPKP